MPKKEKKSILDTVRKPVAPPTKKHLTRRGQPDRKRKHKGDDPAIYTE